MSKWVRYSCASNILYCEHSKLAVLLFCQPKYWRILHSFLLPFSFTLCCTRTKNSNFFWLCNLQTEQFKLASLFNDTVYIIFLFNFRKQAIKPILWLLLVFCCRCRCIIWVCAGLMVDHKRRAHNTTYTENPSDKNDHPNELQKFYDQRTI